MGCRGEETEDQGHTSEPSMAKQGTHRPTRVFIRTRDWGCLTELPKLIIGQSGSSSNSKIESNASRGEIKNPVRLLGTSKPPRLGSGLK